MGGLKDAMLKAGLRATKGQNEREKLPRKKEVSSAVKNQQQRNFCDVCDRTLPDVEHYKHRNPTTEAEWICAACADELMINDKFRTTAQSDMSKKKMFNRNYGETLEIKPKLKK